MGLQSNTGNNTRQVFAAVTDTIYTQKLGRPIVFSPHSIFLCGGGLHVSLGLPSFVCHRPVSVWTSNNNVSLLSHSLFTPFLRHLSPVYSCLLHHRLSPTLSLSYLSFSPLLSHSLIILSSSTLSASLPYTQTSLFPPTFIPFPSPPGSTFPRPCHYVPRCLAVSG